MTELFTSFDFSVLDSPEFKEDAVREELIAPLVKELGYLPSGNNKVIRSKNLKHPFVHIGTKPHRVSIIPDYTFVVGEKPRWILDAKAPTESLTEGKNPEQAYSYAIHPEIRVEYYALCNGREFVLFHISHYEPVMQFPLMDMPEAWSYLFKILSPTAFTSPFKLHMNPDFGLHLKKLGLSRSDVTTHFLMEHIQSIGRVNDDLYTIISYMVFENETFATSFDFDKARLEQLLVALPEKERKPLRQALSEQPYRVHFDDDNMLVVNIHAHIGEQIFSNENEEYLPFVVKEFS
jgi:hypothetical protein